MTAEYPPVPTSVEELAAEITALIKAVGDPDAKLGNESDGYGKCVEAMWRAGYLAHEFAAHQLGVSGFQHSMSSLHLLGALRRIEGPYMIVDASIALYPQNDLAQRVTEFLESGDTRRWLADKAAARLAEDADFAGPAVKSHWWALVANRPESEDAA